MKRVAIIAAKRSAIGSFGGAFIDTSAVTLGTEVLEASLHAGGVAPESVDEVIVGNVLSANLGANPARQIALGAGLPVETPAYTINKLCGSGLKAVTLGVQSILLGDADIIVAGGAENMSMTPYVLPGARFGVRMGDTTMVDPMLRDALWDPFGDCHMGETAEQLADRWQISREAMDSFAAESGRRAVAAIDSGRFVDEIVPIAIPRRKGDPIIVDTDEHPRRDVSVEGLARLKPVFRNDGRVTAGNASGINDGAAMVILASEAKVAELGLTPPAWIAGYASAALDPAVMGYGPVPATRRALAKAGWTVDDVALVELNEAFAAQSLAVLKGFEQELGGIDPAIVNVNSGAIALGHPVGASGARVLVTLIHEMTKRGLHRGLATLCIGGGMGIAALVERE